MLNSTIFDKWSMGKVARFVAFLAERVTRGRRGHEPRVVRDAIWWCHQAAANQLDPEDMDLHTAWKTISSSESEAFTTPQWEFLGAVLGVATWTADGYALDASHPSGRMDRLEKHGFARRDAANALDLAQHLGIDSYTLAELYIGMEYGTRKIDDDRRDAALAALVAGHTDVAADIICRP
jgi:hypothetical protein